MGPAYKNPAEQVPPPKVTRPDVPAFTAQTQTPESRLADPLKEARRGLSYAFRAADGAVSTLNEDQLKILESLRENPSVETLNQVVYRDEASGQEYRAEDYLTEGTDSRIAGLPSAVRDYEAALAKANGPWGAGDSADQYRRQWATGQDQAPFVAQNRAEWREYNKRPEVAAGLDAARERIANGAAWEEPGWRAKLQADWQRMNAATTEHLRKLEDQLQRPMTGMSAFATLEAQAKQRMVPMEQQTSPGSTQEAQPPLFGALPLLPGQPGYEEMMDPQIRTPDSPQRSPYDIVGPNEPTVVMPVVPPAPSPARRINPFSRLATAITSLFR